MSWLSERVLQVDRVLARRRLHKPLPLDAGVPVVSFCFDDAPHSACDTGRRILEDQAARGTWYVAGSLTDGLEQGRRCHSLADLKELLRHGHHVGCHTWSHRRCDLLTPDEMRAEIERNSAFLLHLGVPETERHFCYPLGGYHRASTQLVSQHYLSGRATFGGVQVGQADLSLLQAQPLYSQRQCATGVRKLLERTAAQKGWLIFYTHEVEPEPGPWGCTPAQLRDTVCQAQDLGCKILPVHQAILFWQGRLP